MPAGRKSKDALYQYTVCAALLGVQFWPRMLSMDAELVPATMSVNRQAGVRSPKRTCPPGHISILAVLAHNPTISFPNTLQQRGEALVVCKQECTACLDKGVCCAQEVCWSHSTPQHVANGAVTACTYNHCQNLVIWILIIPHLQSETLVQQSRFTPSDAPCFPITLAWSSLREGHANTLCIVPIVTDVAKATSV